MMPDFVRICSQSELPGTGEVREFNAGGHAFCVANLNGTISVLDGVCPHEGGPLGEGSIEEGRVVVTFLPKREPIDLRQRGIDEVQASDLRSRLKSFAADWDRPEMDVYDEPQAG